MRAVVCLTALVLACASLAPLADAAHARSLLHRHMTTDFDSLVAKYVNSDWHDEYLSLLEVSSTATAKMKSLTKWPAPPATTTSFPRFRSMSMASATQDGDSSGGGSSGGSDGGSGSGSGSGGGAEGSLVGACEVCVFVIENKEQHQPYLCRGLKDPNYQKACVETMESLMWWLTNEVYWLNYGCQREMNGAVEWVRPCPAHAVCSWIEQLYTRTPFCPADPYYKKPQ